MLNEARFVLVDSISGSFDVAQEHNSRVRNFVPMRVVKVAVLRDLQ